jgi:hypothetical protein
MTSATSWLVSARLRARSLLRSPPPRTRSAEGEHPADRQRGQAGRQAAQRGDAAVVGPLQVIEAYQHRALQRGFLKQCLDILQKPVIRFGSGTGLGYHATLKQWHGTAEEGVHEGRERYRGVTGLGRPVADRAPGFPRRQHALLEQAALAQARRPFDEPDGPDALA